jgi:hypothetical protein
MEHLVVMEGGDDRAESAWRGLLMEHSHSHEHDHGHGHGHGHDHHHPNTELDRSTVAALDESVPDSDLSPTEVSRRVLLRSAGILGGTAALAVTGAEFAAATPTKDGWIFQQGDRPNVWLAGDHHIHTQLSSDGMYRVIDQARHASAYGLDWLVITDHGGATHARIGVDLVNPQIKAARAELRDTLIFQGFEWNIPSAEHGTIFVAPGSREVDVLKQFENDYDGSVKNASSNSPANEALAVSGIQWLGRQVDKRRVADALRTTRLATVSTARTRSATGATPTRGSRSASRVRPVTRPAVCRRASAPGAPAACTATSRTRTRSPATRPRATAPGAVSTG